MQDKPPHHPSSIGLMERLHRTLKAFVTCCVDKQPTEALPLVFGISNPTTRTCIHPQKNSFVASSFGSTTSFWHQPPLRSRHSYSYRNSAAVWTICTQPLEQVIHPITLARDWHIRKDRWGVHMRFTKATAWGGKLWVIRRQWRNWIYSFNFSDLIKSRKFNRQSIGKREMEFKE